MNVRKKVLAAVAACSLGWSLAANADPYEDGYTMYALYMNAIIEYCSVWLPNEPGAYYSCVMTYRMMIASSALDAYNNTNDEAYLVLYQLMWYGGSS